MISNYSFFLALMGVENIRNDICYPGLKVRMIGTHSGLAMGFYGTSHHCNEDIGALRAIAGLTLMAPCDGNAIRAAFTGTIAHDGPIYLRAGRGREKPVYESPPDFASAAATRCAKAGTRRCSRSATWSARAWRRPTLASRGHRARGRRHVLDRADRQGGDPPGRRAHGVVFTAEEHNISSGFGSAVAEVIAEEGLAARLVRIGMPDEYSLLGPPTHLYRHYGLDAEGVAATVRKALA